MTATARRRATDRVRPGVVILGKHAATRHGLRLALEASADCYEAATPTDAALVADHAWLDVCLIVADRDETALVGQVAKTIPYARVVVVASDVGEEQLLAAVRAGAIGYLSTSVAPARLPYVVEGVMRGEAAIPRVLVARLVEELRSRTKRRQLMLGSNHDVELTRREWEILEQLGRRASTKQMAAELLISEVTVRRHIGAVLKKLDVKNREDAARILDGWNAPKV